MSLIRATLDHRLKVDEVLQIVADEAGHIPIPVMRKMLPVLVQAERELARDLSKVFAANSGKFTAQAYRNALLQIRQAISTVKQLSPTLLDALTVARPEIGRLAVHHIRRELELFAEHFEGSVKPIALEAASIIAAGEQTAMARFGTVARKLGADAEQHIHQQLAVGLVRGESIEEMKRRLVKGIVTEDTLAKIIGDDAQMARLSADVIMRRVGHWSERIVRTETLNAYNVIADDAVKAANKIDPAIERMWNAANDRRVCPNCRDLDGSIAKVGGMFKNLAESPPLHPNCRCVTTAWRSDWSN